MCCYSDVKMKRAFLADLGKRQTFTAWKLLSDNGWVQFGYQYAPGVNKPARLNKRYNENAPTGLHVFLDSRPDDGRRQVQVLVHRDDVIRIGTGSQSQDRWPRQVVVRKLTIRKKEWQRVFGNRKHRKDSGG